MQSYLPYWIRSPYSNAVFLIALFTLTYGTAKERVKRRGGALAGQLVRPKTRDTLAS